MRVLVTGANGLLGRRFTEHLRTAGHEAVAHGRSSGDVSGDLTAPGTAERLLTEADPDAVVHLVGLTNVDRCEREPHEAYTVNVRTVELLAKAMTTSASSGRAAPYLILTSTDQVYDAPGANTEDDVILRNTYALTKLWSERVALGAGGTVLRTNFFGRSHTPGRSSFSDWIREGVDRRGEGMTLFTDVLFSPLSIDTLSAVLVRALERRVPGVFNAGSRDGMSKRDLALSLATRLGGSLECARDGTQADVPLAARRPLGMMMDSGRFERAFEHPLPTLEQEIRIAEL